MAAAPPRAHTRALIVSAFTNAKGYKVIRVIKTTRTKELSLRNALLSSGNCDACDAKPDAGYYVPAGNCWLCPECYAHWLAGAEPNHEEVEDEVERWRYLWMLDRLQNEVSPTKKV